MSDLLLAKAEFEMASKMIKTTKWQSNGLNMALLKSRGTLFDRASNKSLH
jgi:hypothetical protein